MVMFGEVPGNQRVRITITGSDGFSQSAEGVGRAELSRPVSPNGTDTITIENLDVPGCKEAQQRSYDASGQPIMESPFDTNAPSATDLAGAEGEILATPAGAFDEPAVGAFADARSAKSAAQTAAGLRNMDAQGTLVSASSAGDQILADATRVRDQAGAAASASAARSAGQVAAADAKNAWGNVLGDSLASGLEQGLSSAASAFGSEAGSRVAGEIFDDDHGHHDPASGDGDGAEEGATQVASAPQAGTAKSPPKNRGDSKHGDRDRGDRDAGDGGDAGSKAVSATCPACGVTSTFPDGKVSPWCPNCCAGPYSTQCATCGFLWCGKKGPPPACCPNCGTCGSGPAPEALTPPGGSEPGGVVVPGEILVTPADAGSGGGAPLVDPSPLEP